PEEDRAGVGDLAGERLGALGHDLEMLGREAVDERQRGLKRRADDDSAVQTPARARDRRARQALELALHLRFRRPREVWIVGDEDRLRGLVVLGLRQKI